MDRDREHKDGKLHWLAAIALDPARRTDDERLLVSLGLPSPEAPEPTQVEAYTASRAASVCRILLHGALTVRLGAAYVLYTRLVDPAVRGPGALTPATLDAMFVTAMSRVYVPPADVDKNALHLNDDQFHGFVTGSMGLLPPSSTRRAAVSAVLACIQAVACSAMTFALELLVEGGDDNAATSAAVRRCLQLKVHTEMLKSARKDPTQGLPELQEQRRIVSLLAVNSIILAALVAEPHPKELDKLIDDARAVALDALADSCSGRHLRAAAVYLLSSVVSPPRGKVEALAAGAMQHCVDVYSAAGVYAIHPRVMALMAAGNLSYATPNAAAIEPHTTFLFTQLRRYASQP